MFRTVGAAVMLLSSMVALPAQATVVLDQHRFPEPIGGDLVLEGFGVGYVDPSLAPFLVEPKIAGKTLVAVQTFVAGVSGRLDHVDLTISFTFPFPDEPRGIMASLIKGDYHQGARDLVGHVKFDFFDNPISVSDGLNFAISTSQFNFNVETGDSFSLILGPSEGSEGLVFFGSGRALVDFSDPLFPKFVSIPSQYDGGRLLPYIKETGERFDDGVERDLYFATYVDSVAAVPEPASWALMTLGIGAVGAAMRRRRTASETLRLPRSHA